MLTGQVLIVILHPATSPAALKRWFPSKLWVSKRFRDVEGDITEFDAV